MKAVSTTPVSLSRVSALLKERKKETASGELEYEQANTLEYAEAFGVLSESKAEALAEDLQKIVPMADEQAFKIVDLLPKKEDEIKIVLAEAGTEVTPEQLKELVKAVKKCRKA